MDIPQVSTELAWNTIGIESLGAIKVDQSSINIDCSIYERTKVDVVLTAV